MINPSNSIEKKFQNSGWAKKNCLDYIAPLSVIFKQNFNVLKDEFLKEKKLSKLQYSSNLFLELEILKSTMRGAMRYDYRFVQQSFNILKEQYKVYSKFMLGQEEPVHTRAFSALPYFMIHLLDDHSEEGALHIDQHPYFNHYLTNWIPLTEYSNQSLVVVSKSNKWHRYTRGASARLYNYYPKISDLIFKSFFKRDIQLGDILFWHGTVLHKGLCNNFREVQAALVLKIMDRPLIYEPCFEINDLDSFKAKTIHPYSILELYQAVKELTHKVNQFQNCSSKNIDELAKKIKEILPTPKNDLMRYFLSFCLGILAQRSIAQKRPYLHFDLASLELGTDNLVSLERILSSPFYSQDITANLKWFNTLSEKHNSYRFTQIYENIIHKKEILIKENDNHLFPLSEELFKI